MIKRRGQTTQKFTLTAKRISLMGVLTRSVPYEGFLFLAPCIWLALHNLYGALVVSICQNYNFSSTFLSFSYILYRYPAASVTHKKTYPSKMMVKCYVMFTTFCSVRWAVLMGRVCFQKAQDKTWQRVVYIREHSDMTHESIWFMVKLGHFTSIYSMNTLVGRVLRENFTAYNEHINTEVINLTNYLLGYWDCRRGTLHSGWHIEKALSQWTFLRSRDYFLPVY